MRYTFEEPPISRHAARTVANTAFCCTFVQTEIQISNFVEVTGRASEPASPRRYVCDMEHFYTARRE
jgi:nitrate reductase cytochrome c-type subunit